MGALKGRQGQFIKNLENKYPVKLRTARRYEFVPIPNQPELKLRGCALRGRPSVVQDTAIEIIRKLEQVGTGSS